MGRMLTTIGPAKQPAGLQVRLVTYMGTLQPSSQCLRRMPAASSGCSNVKLQPSRKLTRSSRQ